VPVQAKRLWEARCDVSRLHTQENVCNTV
jgi:hypothetical protein